MDHRNIMPIAVRAFVPGPESPPIDHGNRRPRPGPSHYTLIFDTETSTNAAQHIRFGTYQIRQGEALEEAGIFYDPASLTEQETKSLLAYAGRHGRTVRTVPAFIDDILFPYGYDCRAMIVGFNLPFDISRLAVNHGSARGKIMRGGFTFKLSANRSRPSVQVKHLSRRAAMIRFTVPGKQRTPRGQRRRKMTVPPHRGFFVDIKTVAAALTSRSFSLGNLGEFLGVASVKLTAESHGGPLTEDYLAYAERDVQTSWECFLRLRDRYGEHRLTATPLNAIYSEAGLGKAYLKEMGICPWREAQPDMPQEMIGAIVSSYYGGRSEVHIRRQIEQIAYCDFLSMYPTVCVLMGLWRFVIAQGMMWEEATEQAQGLLDAATVDDLQSPSFWGGLTILVAIVPQADLFPVRARYGIEAHYTIGLNHLASEAPPWFTLADCIAAKLLTGKMPKLIRAIRFTPGPVQAGLKQIDIAGQATHHIDPARNDFYRRLIDLRSETRTAMTTAASANRDHLDAAQMALKILANATSYGIFFELNVEELADPATVQCFARHEAGFPVEIEQSETPGRYFHPLLATLITGAARLMLASAERLAVDAGLDWVFCDTDSLAIARPQAMEEAIFWASIRTIREWFTPLNPYAVKAPLLKLEDANFALGQPDVLAPLYAFAISAKRYALFNLDDRGQPIIRKASAHGLGHLIAPYTDASAPLDMPSPIAPLDDMGVERWQHDVWYRIVSAALDRHPDQVPLGDLPGFALPSVSRYGATTPSLLRWFKSFNHGKPYREQVRPFGFMLAFQAMQMMDMPGSAPVQEPANGKLQTPGSPLAKKAADAPRAVAPFDRDLAKAAMQCFDRDTGKPVSAKRLKTYTHALLRYHLHPEAKFLGGEYRHAGITRRRHIQANSIHLIGKEANRWEEQFHLGADPEAQTEYGMPPDERERAMATVHEAVERFGLRALAKAAHMSRTLLAASIQSKAALPDRVIAKLGDAVIKLDQKEKARKDREAQSIAALRERIAKESIRGIARKAGVDDSHLVLILSGRRRLTPALMRRIGSVAD